ncbi:MAG: sensor histidine kinase [Syntrophothermus sp.]
MNKLKEYLRHSKPYTILISGIYLFSLVLFYIIFHDYSFFAFALLSFLFCFCIIILLGSIRRKEILSIRHALNGIRIKTIKNSEEILLGSNLIEMEEDLRRMFEQSQQDIEYLKKLEQIRSEFLGNVSHELRTPIFTIQGYLETLIDGAMYDNNVNKNFLLKASHHVQNLNSLLNDLIDISMIESGAMNLSFRYFSFREFIEEIIRDLQLAAEEKGLLLVLQAFENVQVLGDRNKLRQVMVNLIHNAIKYTESGRVEIIGERSSGALKITVKDTGIGISDEDIPRIFERFYRVNKDRSRMAGGTGLGLAIVKHIIEAHDSRIEVKSEPGKGSSFSFLLKI